MMGLLPYGEEITIVGRTMWTQFTSVTDGQTDRQTDRITITKTVQRRASHGKNWSMISSVAPDFRSGYSESGIRIRPCFDLPDASAAVVYSKPHDVMDYETNRFAIGHFLLVVHQNRAFYLQSFSRYSSPKNGVHRQTLRQTHKVKTVYPPVSVRSHGGYSNNSIICDADIMVQSQRMYIQ